MLKNGGFRLTKWQSNSPKVIQQVPEAERVASSTEAPVQQRVLGLIWDISNDQLSLQPVNKALKYTKRGNLSFISTIFDPLGILVPFILEAKLLVKELWRLKLDWDDPIPQNLISRFDKWSSSIHLISEVQVPRWFGRSEASLAVQLHLFADASTKAFGAVAYLRILNLDTVTTCFVMGKSRLAPIKPVIIPKLELQAAVTAVRLKESILNNLPMKIDETVFWTDSATVLKYIRNKDKRFPVYVMHRVNEIKTHSAIDNWRHVPGDLDVADECTRSSLTVRSTSSKWLTGPAFLSEPFLPVFESLEPETDQHLQQEVNILHQTTGFTIPWNNFSSWRRLVRLMAFIIKLKNHWINRRCKHTNTTFNVHLTTEEILQSEQSLLQICQGETFPNEHQRLSSNQEIENSAILPLRPILWKGLLRVGGRIKHAEVPFGTKHQVILSHTHPASKLLLYDIHLKNTHAGVNHLLALSRETYWIT